MYDFNIKYYSSIIDEICVRSGNSSPSLFHYNHHVITLLGNELDVYNTQIATLAMFSDKVTLCKAVNYYPSHL